MGEASKLSCEVGNGFLRMGFLFVQVCCGMGIRAVALARLQPVVVCEAVASLRIPIFIMRTLWMTPKSFK